MKDLADRQPVDTPRTDALQALLSDDAGRHLPWGVTMAEHARQLERELAEAKREAERYRWLRDSTKDIHGAIDERLYVACDDVRYKGLWALTGVELDAAIDAAMKAPNA